MTHPRLEPGTFEPMSYRRRLLGHPTGFTSLRDGVYFQISFLKIGKIVAGLSLGIIQVRLWEISCKPLRTTSINTRTYLISVQICVVSHWITGTDINFSNRLFPNVRTEAIRCWKAHDMKNTFLYFFYDKPLKRFLKKKNPIKLVFLYLRLLLVVSLYLLSLVPTHTTTPPPKKKL